MEKAVSKVHINAILQYLSKQSFPLEQKQQLIRNRIDAYPDKLIAENDGKNSSCRCFLYIQSTLTFNKFSLDPYYA